MSRCSLLASTLPLCLCQFRLAALLSAISVPMRSLKVEFDIVGMIKALGTAVKDAVAEAIKIFK